MIVIILFLFLVGGLCAWIWAILINDKDVVSALEEIEQVCFLDMRNIDLMIKHNFLFNGCQ